MSNQNRCPVCGEDGLRPVIYGLVVGKLVDKARQGEVVLGGCQVGERSPQWGCPKCGELFTEPERREAWPENR